MACRLVADYRIHRESTHLVEWCGDILLRSFLGFFVKTAMRFINWNVNGIRAALGKGFGEFFEKEAPDFMCLQETKCSDGQVQIDAPGYYQYWNYAVRKGYSGTAIFTRYEPISVSYGIGVDEHDEEGRVITLEYGKFYFVTVYTPNSGRGLDRLGYRMEWEDAFRDYLKTLEMTKPVVFCGDLNVAHREIDLKNPKSNRRNAGFTDEERNKFTQLLDSGFVDTYRYLYPDAEDAYTWWSYFAKARERNIGWRIDYFVVSEALKNSIREAGMMPEVFGSDHCPVFLELDIKI